MINTHQKLEIPLVEKTREAYKLLFRYLECFPKKERYSMGQMMEKTLLSILEEIFLANSMPKIIKEPCLQKLNAKTELFKTLIRISFELNLLSSNQYLTISEKTIEIGKMIGGWIKYVKDEN